MVLLTERRTKAWGGSNMDSSTLLRPLGGSQEDMSSLVYSEQRYILRAISIRMIIKSMQREILLRESRVNTGRLG